MKENYKSHEAQPTQSARTKNSYSPTYKGIALAVFVKTPGLSPIKTRLAKNIGAEQAINFYRQSVEATARVLENVRRQFHYVHLYWAVAEADGLRDLFWRRKDWNLIGQGEGTLGERLGRVWRQLRSSHDAVIFMGADSPHVSDDVVESAVEILTLSGLTEACGPEAWSGQSEALNGQSEASNGLNERVKSSVVGPTEDGGFYLFGSSTWDFPWEAVSYSTENTLSELLSVFGLEKNIFRLPKTFDIDEASDLKRLNNEIPFWGV